MAAHILTSENSEHLIKLIELSLKATATSKYCNTKYAFFKALTHIRFHGIVLTQTHSDKLLIDKFNLHLNALDNFFIELDEALFSRNTSKTLELTPLLDAANKLRDIGKCLVEQQEYDPGKYDKPKHIRQITENLIAEYDMAVEQYEIEKNIIKAQAIVAKRGKQ